MAWGDPASWSTTDSELAALLPVFYSKRIRELINVPTGLWDKLELDPFVMRSGQTATFMQYARLDAIAASTYLTEGANPAPTDLVPGKITALIKEKGGVVAIPSLARQTLIDGAEKVAQVVSEWAKESMELYAACTITPYWQQLAWDGSTTYYKDRTTTGAGSTTLLADTGSTEAINFWAGGLVTITDPTVGCFGESSFATSSAQNVSVTVGVAFSVAPGTACKYHISIPTAVASGDLLTLAAVRAGQKALRKNGCFGPQWEIAGGGYNMLLDAVTEADVQTDLISVYQYKDADSILRKYPDGGMIAMCRPAFTGVPFHSAVGGAGTYDAAGAVHYTPLWGKNSAAKMPIEDTDIKVIAKAENSGGVANPLNRYSTTGWELALALAKKNMAAGVVINTVDN